MSATPALRRWYRFQVRLGRRLERLVFLALLIFLVWLPLPFGSKRPWAESLLMASIGLLLVFWAISVLLSRPRLRRLWPGTAFMVLLWACWLGWSAMQTLPLPQEWVAEKSPQRWAQVQSSARLSEAPVPSSIAPSLDPELTRRQVWLSASYAGLFFLVASCLRRRRRFRRLFWVLLLSGLGQAVYGSVMVMSGLEYGAWGHKQAYIGAATGTFVNRNHLAGYLELCLAAGIGLIMARPLRLKRRTDWRQRVRQVLVLLQDERLFVRGAIAILFIGLLMTQSRMGNVAAVAGVCGAAVLGIVTRPRVQTLRWLLLLGSILAIDIWLFGRWFGLDQLAERYAQIELSSDVRVRMLEDLRHMIPQYQWLGSGLGTFMLAYPPFRSADIGSLFDQAHNDYGQFLIESGLPGTLLLAAMVVATLTRALLILRRRNDALARGVAFAGLVAIGALAVHSTADFNLQIPANAATLIALMAAVWAASPVSTVRPATPKRGVLTYPQATQDAELG